MEDVIKKIDKTIIVKSHHIIRTKNGDYFYKKINLEGIYNELIIYELSKIAGIDCVKPFYYDRPGREGIITKSYLTDSYHRLPGTELLYDYYKYIKDDSILPSSMNNLVVIKKSLKYRYDNLELIKNLMSGFNKIFSFDIITMQCDRLYNNWELLESNDMKNCKISPLFDNEYAFYKDNSFLDTKCSDVIRFDYKDCESTIRNTLMNYLTNASNEYIKEFIDIFEKLNLENLKTAITNANKNSDISQVYISKIIDVYKKNYEEIKKILMNLNLIDSEVIHHAR